MNPAPDAVDYNVHASRITHPLVDHTARRRPFTLAIVHTRGKMRSVERIRVVSTKYDGSPHWTLECFVLRRGDWGWLTYHPVDTPVSTHRGDWLTNHAAIGWRWADRWWDAHLVFNRAGQWVEWYCNVNTPPAYRDGALRYCDLDLDIVLSREHGLHIADEDEFEVHRIAMAYPDWLVDQARQTAREVFDTMTRGAWRFGEATATMTIEGELARWTDGTI